MNEQLLIDTIRTLLAALSAHERQQRQAIANFRQWQREAESLIELMQEQVGTVVDGMARSTALQRQIAEALGQLNAERDGESWES